MSPAWTEGGLRETRPGFVVTGAMSPAWTEGGLREMRPGFVVTGAMSPAWTEGGLRETRPGSETPDQSRESYLAHTASAKAPCAAATPAPGSHLWPRSRRVSSRADRVGST